MDCWLFIASRARSNWLQRARACLRRAAADRSPHFLPDALYKGAVGLTLLAEELQSPETAAMPLFEPGA